ncbi:uncharacterized protein LOC121368556 [Gigantopelta aegis]|uniref:uncharacterized protein LOC121368556 n=1 Tax=Gigantopelta aegis TaxID=1735272 RepID=UPI001B88A144|nr:uncharacterized protein LOC121368556 [Gigantopelta aegis]
MALTYNRELWSTNPQELIRIPVAVVRSLPPVELTLSYSTHTSAAIKGYVGGKLSIRTSYAADGKYVVSQQFLNGSEVAGDISTYSWNLTDGEHTDLNTKYGVNLTFDVQQKVLFNASISWHEKDIAIDLAPPIEITLKPSVHVLSKVKGHSQCLESKVNVTGDFHVSKAELEVEAFGLTIWDVVLHPEMSKTFTMTTKTLRKTCRAHCHSQVQLGPPETAEDYEVFMAICCSSRQKEKIPHEHVQVEEAWDEPSSSHPNGRHNSSSLYYEGRAAVVAVDVHEDDVVNRLAELAVCASFDYVRILEATGQVEVAVKRNGEPTVDDEHDDDWSKQMFREAMNTTDIDEATTSCLKSAPSLSVGESYPDGSQSETEMCGPLQKQLYMDDQRDMKRLYHYTFTDVEFTAETGGNWCGIETRLCRPCDPLDSRESWDWCITRMMTPRIAVALRTMAQTARADGIEIKVLASFLEESGQTNNSGGRSELYREGRGIMLTTKTGKDLNKLARHAICAGIDYVRYTTPTYIEGFVLPQSDYQAKLINFIDGPSHLEVKPPSTLADEYKHPIHLNNEDAKPQLVDGHYDQHAVSEHYTLADIKDPGKRYLRFDSSLLECLELASDDLDSVFKIVPGSAYRTRSSNRNNLDTRHPEEMWRFEAGQAVEIKHGKTDSDQALVDMASSILKSCTTFLRLDLRGIGLGCHSDRLYLDVRPLIEGLETEFITLWNTDNTTYCKEIGHLKDALHKGGPAIAPIDVSTTCSNIPVGDDLTYITFQFGQNELCDVKPRVTFCSKSRTAREEEVLKLQERMTDTAGFGRLPRHVIMPDIKACLFDLCGGCPGAGPMWDKKVKACANMVHKYLSRAARPFPDLKDKASFYNTASPVSSVHSLACHDHNVCVESVQLHSIFMPLVSSLYRPNITSSQEFMLFSSEQNPVPILELVEQEMAYRASGKVKVFIEEDKDVSSLRHVLKVIMAYNRNVTEVEFHVADDLDEDLVGAAIQRKIDMWAKNTCPKWSRFAIAPYSVHTIPPSRKKRSLERSKDRNEARSRIHDWEMEWLMKLL